MIQMLPKLDITVWYAVGNYADIMLHLDSNVFLCVCVCLVVPLECRTCRIILIFFLCFFIKHLSYKVRFSYSDPFSDSGINTSFIHLYSILFLITVRICISGFICSLCTGTTGPVLIGDLFPLLLSVTDM